MPLGPYNYIPTLFPYKPNFMGNLASMGPLNDLYQPGQGFNLDLLKQLFAKSAMKFAPSSGGPNILQKAFNLPNFGGTSPYFDLPGVQGGPTEWFGGDPSKKQPGKVGKAMGGVFGGGSFTNPFTGSSFDLSDPGSTIEALNDYLQRNFGVQDLYQLLGTDPKHWTSMAGEIQNPRFDPTTGALIGPTPKGKGQAEKYQTISSSMASFLQEQARQNAIAEAQRMLGLSQGAFPGTSLGLQMPFAQQLGGIYGGTQYQPGDYSYFLNKYNQSQGDQDGGGGWEQILQLIGPLLGLLL